MNRDDMPTGAAVALAFGELMVTAKRLTAQLPRLNESTPDQLADAVTAVRASIAGIWPNVLPEAARDVMVTATGMASHHGVRSLPEGLADETADWPLVMTGQDGVPEAGAIGSALAFASSVAFDRDEDDQTLTSVAVLLTLAHLALPRPGAVRHDRP